MGFNAFICRVALAVLVKFTPSDETLLQEMDSIERLSNLERLKLMGISSHLEALEERHAFLLEVLNGAIAGRQTITNYSWDAGAKSDD